MTASLVLEQPPPRGPVVLAGDGAVESGADRLRPTLEDTGHGGKEPLLEVNLFDFDGDLYAQHMRVALVDYLRPEWKFDDLAALKVQMLEDARRARVILAAELWQAGWPAGPFLPALSP